MLTRTRKNEDGTTTKFMQQEFKNLGPYRAEVVVRSMDELRALRQSGVLIGVRMISTVADGRAPQINLVPVSEIEGW